MIELTWNESAAGSLKMARENKTWNTDGSERVIVDCETNGSKITGDIIPLSLYLDIGDISDIKSILDGRRKLLDDLFEEYPGVSAEIWQANQNALSRLEQAKQTKEPIRIWVLNGNPEELCGLYFICHAMAGRDVPLSVVRIPEQIEREDGIVSYRNTGEILPEDFKQYVRYEEPVSSLKRTIFANFWTSLMQENAPLRACINGTLMGVPEDFYDFALRANIPKGECSIALLIGRALLQTPGIRDHWLYLRVKAMLAAGELETVKMAADHHYQSVIKRRQ